MEAQRSSRKRKQRPPNPLTGIFTRSKSQRYLHHCNRSGKFRPDPVRKTRPIQPPPSSILDPKVPICQRLNNVDEDDDEISHISIKDLRARRVFSQPRDGFGKNINPNCDSEVVICKSNESDGKPDGFGAYVETPILSVSEKCDSKVDFKDKGLNDRNPNLSEKCDLGVYDKGSNGGTPNSTNESIATAASDGGGEILKPKKEEKFDVSLVFSGLVPDSMSPNLNDKELKGRKCKNSEVLIEETVQTTPPDAVILIRQSDDPNVVNGNTASSLAPKQVSPIKDEGKKTNANMKKNSGLKPCSRPKVFRAPNSFSYRRLLPYLMDLAKDTSSPLKLNTCLKSENGVEEKPLLSSSQDSLRNGLKADDKQATIVPICTILEVSNGAKEESELHQASMKPPIDSSHGNSQAHLVSNENQIVTPVSDNLEKLGDHSPVVQSNFAALLDIPKGNTESPAKDATVEAKCGLSLVEFKMEENSISVFHSSSKAGALVSASVPVGLAKGILKKNPRGCRGTCNCLNCASFRLNAEKAFDFSRNQLLDAQELAQDLMKELSDLRCVLENSVNGGNSLATIPVNQVQEACRRASNVEDIARSRLSQMNEDLYVHCRNKPLQRPRVNFSFDVKEKAIREAK